MLARLEIGNKIFSLNFTNISISDIFLQKFKTSVLLKFKELYVKSTMHKNISEMH